MTTMMASTTATTACQGAFQSGHILHFASQGHASRRVAGLRTVAAICIAPLVALSGCTSSTRVIQPEPRHPPPAAPTARSPEENRPAEPPTEPKGKTPPGDRVVSLPGLTAHLDTREIRIDGQFCIQRGILEYLAVASGGKEYESVLRLDCRPSHLQIVALLAGYQVGELPAAMRGDFSPQADDDTERPEGAPTVTSPPEGYWKRETCEPTRVAAQVEVRQPDGTWRRRPIEDFLLDRRTGRPPPPLNWAFSGSFFYKAPETEAEVYVADLEKSVIALWYDPTALFNLTQDVGNPYRGESIGLEVNPEALPERGTPVRLLLRPLASD